MLRTFSLLNLSILHLDRLVCWESFSFQQLPHSNLFVVYLVVDFVCYEQVREAYHLSYLAHFGCENCLPGVGLPDGSAAIAPFGHQPEPG